MIDEDIRHTDFLVALAVGSACMLRHDLGVLASLSNTPLTPDQAFRLRQAKELVDEALAGVLAGH